jgi:hypothetical protein
MVFAGRWNRLGPDYTACNLGAHTVLLCFLARLGVCRRRIRAGAPESRRLETDEEGGYIFF